LTSTQHARGNRHDVDVSDREDGGPFDRGGDDELRGDFGDDTLNGGAGTGLCVQGAGSGSKTACES
jgi:hypothetical protein